MPLPDPPKGPSLRAGTLWLYSMPGLTPEVLRDVAAELELVWFGQMVNLHPTQWIEYKKKCAEKVGLPPDWEERAYLSAYEQAKAAGWGKKFGPGSPGGWKRKEKKEYVEVDRSNKGWDTSGTLFDSNLSTEHEGDV